MCLSLVPLIPIYIQSFIIDKITKQRTIQEYLVTIIVITVINYWLYQI